MKNALTVPANISIRRQRLGNHLLQLCWLRHVEIDLNLTPGWGKERVVVKLIALARESSLYILHREVAVTPVTIAGG